jgi:hypothetical protein
MHERSREELVSMMHEVSSRLETKTKSPFDEIRTAVKRAKHFTKNISIGGPCSPTGRAGLSIPVRNGLWLLDLKESLTEDDYKAEFYVFEWMAKTINRWIDEHMIEGDEEAIWALGAFLSRLWFNVEKLEC